MVNIVAANKRVLSYGIFAMLVDREDLVNVEPLVSFCARAEHDKESDDMPWAR